MPSLLRPIVDTMSAVLPLMFAFFLLLYIGIILWAVYRIVVGTIWGEPPRHPSALTRDDVMRIFENALAETAAGKFPESPEWYEFINADFDDPALARAQYPFTDWPWDRAEKENEEEEEEEKMTLSDMEEALRDHLAMLRFRRPTPAKPGQLDADEFRTAGDRPERSHRTSLNQNRNR